MAFLPMCFTPACSRPASFTRTAGARALAACLLAAALAGCTVVSGLPQAPAEPAPGSGQVAPEEPYRIQVGDVLDVKLVQVTDLSEEVTVRPDGHISTAIVDDQQAYGMTVPELAAALRKAYGSVLRDPKLTVVVKSFSPVRIYVGGEVAQPGEFITIPPNLTLSQAVARAGGVKLSGSDDIIILRRGPNNTPQVFATRYRDVRRGADPTADVRLANFDVVYVPRSGIAQSYLYFNQYLQQFIPVSWGFSYVLNSSTTTPVTR